MRCKQRNQQQFIANQCGPAGCGPDGCDPRYVVQQPPRRGFRLLRSAFHLCLLWAAAVFVGGTLIATDQPGMMHFGEALHTVTFVEPLTDWAIGEGHFGMAKALDLLSGGIDVV